MTSSIDITQTFELSGPQNLNKLDWKNPNHRAIAFACLVQGVYVLQTDKELNREIPLAPSWWKSVHYELLELVMNEKQSHINGAVYRWKGISLLKPKHAPLIVVAFRGTILESEATSSDMAINLKIISNKLHKTFRFEVAFDVVKRMIMTYRSQNICIAGHSLGAALGLLVGRRMAEEGCYLEAHLFNPPFASLPLEMVLGETISRQLSLVHILVTAGLAFLLKDLESEKKYPNSSLKTLDDWFPNLYLNVYDVICSAYLNYFSVNKYLMIPFNGTLAAFTTPFFLRRLLHSMFRFDCKPYHLIPSASLHVSYMRYEGSLEPHYLSNWWLTNITEAAILARSGNFNL